VSKFDGDLELCEHDLETVLELDADLDLCDLDPCELDLCCNLEPCDLDLCCDLDLAPCDIEPCDLDLELCDLDLGCDLDLASCGLELCDLARRDLEPRDLGTAKSRSGTLRVWRGRREVRVAACP
jgi:hypothetical protein